MRSPLPNTLPAVVLAVAALAAPAAVHAATITSDGAGGYTYADAPGEQDQLSVQSREDGSVVFFTHDTHITSMPGTCTPDDVYGDVVAHCTGAAKVALNLGDQDDQATLSYAPDDVYFPTVIDAGPGNDWIRGEDRADEIHGGPGNDKLEGFGGNDVLDGGDGDDELNGKGGADHLLGGAGNDLLMPDNFEDPSADVVDGGPGTDTIESDWSSRFYSGPPQLLTLTLGGGADDGRPGEGDDIQNVERFTLSDAVNFTGTDAPEYVKEHQVGQSGVLIGNGGDDELRGGDGADKIDGGRGNDLIDGGYGDDTIVGGPGKDTISADLQSGDCGVLWCKVPYGNDTVDVRDGEVDSVTCGAGQDTVKADPIDVVSPDCEVVDRGGAGPGPGTTGPTGPGKTDGPQPGTTTGHATLKLAGSAKLGAALRGGLKVKVAGAKAGTVTLTAKRGAAVVAKGSGKAGAAGTATVRLTFTKAARKALRAKRSVTLKVSGGGASATITLRR